MTLVQSMSITWCGMPILKWCNTLVNVITIINKCDMIEKNSAEFITTCHLLQEKVPNSNIREELLHLANYAQKISPKCTAAGFFVVNRFILGALFSSVTTYLIICIQFNMNETSDLPIEN
ncbi:putative gustatory receptor 28b [Diabrotica virgifera virgifera]|uniref:Gustatory receptor 28b n=2 Tax=Diabrotica virgifera virgifera TaxID=50390 RepID=A0ABM5KCE9_DIAVI|nr:putative gustatory receptor 28b [Diabrotica virgifera virgifera]